MLLWEVLRKFGCPTSFLTILAALHEDMNAVVMAGGKTSELFSVSLGVKQGCVLAAVLFNLFTAAVTMKY